MGDIGLRRGSNQSVDQPAGLCLVQPPEFFSPHSCSFVPRCVIRAGQMVAPMRQVQGQFPGSVPGASVSHADGFAMIPLLDGPLYVDDDFSSAAAPVTRHRIIEETEKT